MSITDELRKEARGFGLYVYAAPQAERLTAIADRIDAEHESACAEAYGNGVMSVPIALDESAWVELPKDADGEYIHVGDVMEWVDPDGEATVTCTVDAVGVGCFFAWDNANTRFAQKCANAYRHHHAPTVEDVLWELLDEIENFHSLEEARDTIAEYASKLRLVEGEDA